MPALNQLKDFKGSSNFSPPMSSSIFEVSLPGAGAEKLLNVPDGKRLCIISATGNYAVSADTTAAMPGSANFTATNSELNKSAIWLYSSDTNFDFPKVNVLHFVSTDPVLMTVSFFD